MTKHIVEISSHNFAIVWDTVVAALREATFISIDAEFTGLGDNKQGTAAQNMEERYDAMANIAKSQSIVELGISIFKCVGMDSYPCTTYFSFKYVIKENTFISDYIFSVTPKSLTFLVENGFDFNKLFVSGIPFSTRQVDEAPNAICSLRTLFALILELKPILVLHNGLFDLLFLFHSFVGNLPASFSDFVRVISDSFPVIYDTKCIAEYYLSTEASYLEYLYHKCQRQNTANSSVNVANAKCTHVVNSQLEQYLQHWQPNPASPSIPIDVAICYHYSRHGFCRNGKRCNESHDIHIILDAEENQRNSSKKRRRVKRNNADEDKGIPKDIDSTPTRKRGPTSETTLDVSNKKNKTEVLVAVEAESASDSSISAPSTSSALSTPRRHSPTNPASLPLTPATPTPTSPISISLMTNNGCHSAGYDAYMTGYIFASFVVQFKEKPPPIHNILSPSPQSTTTTSTSPTVNSDEQSNFTAQSRTNDVMSACKNRVYLMLKDFPLLLHKSKYE